MRLAGINAHHGNTELAEPKADRRRHAARLDHRPFDWAMAFEQNGQGLWRTLDLLRRTLVAILVNNADLRGFH